MKQCNAPACCLTDDRTGCCLQAVYQPQGGILASELCIAAHIQAAQSHGAEFHSDEKAESWKVDPLSGVVTVYTDRGQYTAHKLVLTAGSWMPDIMPELQVVSCLTPPSPSPKPSPQPLLTLPQTLSQPLLTLDCEHSVVCCSCFRLAFFGFDRLATGTVAVQWSLF